MSAFIVNNKTISSIVQMIEESEFLKRKVFDEFGHTFNSHKNRQHFGNMLYALNISAVSQRYGTADDMVGESFKLETISDNTDIQAYKDLECFLHQCSEGDIKEKSKLYKFLDGDVRNSFANKIIHALSEYDSAKWD